MVAAAGSRDAVVVGGGVAGMIAARMFRDRGYRVAIVEKEGTLGGLLGSVADANGVTFDFGAHVHSETGVAEIDRLLLEGVASEDWHAFGVVRAGNLFRGTLNRDSPFPDARLLPADRFERGFAELLRAAESPGAENPGHLGQALEARFGATFAREVVGPALFKQLRTPIEHLDPRTPFALRRIICADAESSRRLKQRAELDEVIAFTSYREGMGSIAHRYPKHGGMATWVNRFSESLDALGVRVVTGSSVTSFEQDGRKITTARLDNGTSLPCDVVAWTLPAAMMLVTVGERPVGGRPMSHPIGLFHFVFDLPFEDENYHVTCYDESFRFFRVTLYPNVRGAPELPPFNCTVEVIGDPGEDFEALSPRVHRELVEAGLVNAAARLMSTRIDVVPFGFPATTHDFIDSATRNAQRVQELFENVLLMGRAKCPPFFTSDVLGDALDTVRSWHGE